VSAGKQKAVNVSNPRKVTCIVGTRPEVIKMAPVIVELRKRPEAFETSVLATAQHRAILDQMMETFRIKATVDLNLMEANQTPVQLLSHIVASTDQVVRDLAPELVLVQGDTTTVMAVSLVAFLNRIPVGHVEAGLRSFDNYNPFPEEVSRRVASLVASFHFAPTERAKSNLLREGVPEQRIFVTGNTAVDALLSMRNEAEAIADPKLDGIDFARHKVILLTAHRRENHGPSLRNICQAILSLVNRNQDVAVVYPVHPNPNVRSTVEEMLGGRQRIHLMPPIEYLDMIRIMSRCYLILTDSGGIQEEAPTFGKPVLVLRNVTERPEGIEAGVSKLIGTQTDAIVREVESLLNDRQKYEEASARGNPYGDGQAARRIVDILQRNLR
jgi:UDP-N-acetylglucosamine 2-epimerase (non-hydrolysing)